MMSDHEEMPTDPEAFAQWLEQHPEVQKANRLFPLGAMVKLNDETRWVVGYSPNGHVVTIASDPATLEPPELMAQVDECVLLDVGDMPDPAAKKH